MMRFVRGVGLFFLVIIGFALLTLMILYWTLPSVSYLRNTNPSVTAMMITRIEKARSLGRPYPIKYTFVPLSDISVNLQNAVIFSEDVVFYKHKGFSLGYLLRTIKYNFHVKKLVRGSSSITQQLAKNLFLKPDKTLSRKLVEALLTIKLENELSKNRILELYLNVVEWGNGIYGIEEASKFYYKKPASDLSLDESIRLATALPNPRIIKPNINTRALVLRRLVISRFFYNNHLISAEELKGLQKQLKNIP